MSWSLVSSQMAPTSGSWVLKNDPNLPSGQGCAETFKKTLEATSQPAALPSSMHLWAEAEAHPRLIPPYYPNTSLLPEFST